MQYTWHGTMPRFLLVLTNINCSYTSSMCPKTLFELNAGTINLSRALVESSKSMQANKTG
jgi:hypothetical protein